MPTQVPTRPIATSAQSGSPSQPRATPSRPTARSSVVERALRARRSARHTTATTVRATTWGRKITVRKKPAPADRERVISAASSSPSEHREQAEEDDRARGRARRAPAARGRSGRPRSCRARPRCRGPGRPTRRRTAGPRSSSGASRNSPKTTQRRRDVEVGDAPGLPGRPACRRAARGWAAGAVGQPATCQLAAQTKDVYSSSSVCEELLGSLTEPVAELLDLGGDQVVEVRRRVVQVGHQRVLLARRWSTRRAHRLRRPSADSVDRRRPAGCRRPGSSASPRRW